MIRPEGPVMSKQPHEAAVANPSLLETSTHVNNNVADFRRHSSIITPEGYDVSVPMTADKRFSGGAIAYLIEVHGRELPRVRHAGDVLEALQDEPRAAVYNYGRAQSVFEHTMALRAICREELSSRPDLEAGLVNMMAKMHDAPEVFGGDTVISDQDALDSKFFREEAGMTLLRHSMSENDRSLQALEAYRDPKTPAELKAKRFVDGLDKNEAYEFQLRPDVQAALHRIRQEEFEPLVMTALPKIRDRSAGARIQRTLIELGENWHEWGCKPFEGEPRDIVAKAVGTVLMQRVAQQPNVRSLNLAPKAVVHGTGPAYSPEALEDMGVAVLDKARRRNWFPDPPATSPAFAAA